MAYLLPEPAAPSLIPSIPKKISEEKIIDVAEVNPQPWLEESGQWLENVDLTKKKLLADSLNMSLLFN